MEYDVTVIGGGAAGLLAAGTAARAGARVLLLERGDRPGRKICLTGKGRCNLTNLRPAGEFLAHVKANAGFFRPAFMAFDNVRTEEFFRGIGLETVHERGERVFPASGRAADVADVLAKWCLGGGVEMRFGCRAEEILTEAGAVTGVRTTKGEFASRSVIIATGGVSYPVTGSTGEGFAMAHALGHRIEPLRPSLVALYSSHPGIPTLEGQQLRNISVSLRVDGRTEAAEFGEMEFVRSRTSKSTIELAGALILRLSRAAVDALFDGRTVEVALDLKPALDLLTLTARIERETAALGPSGTLGGLLRKLVPAPLVAFVARELGYAPSGPVVSTPQQLQRPGAPRPIHRKAPSPTVIARLLKEWRIPITGHAPFEEAIVTAGGVDVAQVDPATLESRLVKGFYLAGEVLDLDADTGGYNLQIAFSTGRLAGQSAAAHSKR